MIRVVRIAGESYDLETGATRSKELVLSNGYREVSLPVEDEAIQAVLLMMAEIRGETQLREEAPEPPSAPEGNGGRAPHVIVELVDDILVKDEAHAAYEPEMEDEYEPGEEYNDPATGVESL
jgi:hypothetical protein